MNDEYEEYWTSDDFVLLSPSHGSGGYSILDLRHKGMVIIEDDDAYDRTVRKMLEEGVVVVSRIPWLDA